MNTMESLAEVDTNTLEAALEAAISGIPASDEPPTQENEPIVNDEQADNEVVVENEQSEYVESDDTESEAEAVAEESQEADTDFESEAEVIHGHWAEDEKLAAQIRDNNPDIPLDTALALARARLGYTANADQPDEPETQEPSLDDQIQAIENALEEMGANEGLFTKDTADLTKQLARLVSQKATREAIETIQIENTQRREQEIADKESARLTSLMQDSVQRVYAMSPEAENRNSAIGRAIEQQIKIWTAENSADLHKPNTPELVYWAAQSLLPPESRVSAVPREQPKHAQPASITKQAQVQKTSEATAAIPIAPPVPTVRALPVSAMARTAQPDSINLNPSQVGQLVKDASKDDLAAIEEAIYGVSGRDVLLRI